MGLFRSSVSSDGKKLSIPLDNDHNWIQTRSKTLFVRKCYNEIWDEVQQHYNVIEDGPIAAEGTLDGFFISGTPGVGKSCFLDFCLHNLLRLGKSVCYFYGKTMTARIFKADGTVETYIMADNVEGALAAQVDFLLIDPPENGDPNFLGGRVGLSGKKFILAVSPDRNNCQAIRKETSTVKLYMGTCSLEEAEEMKVACYPGVTHQRVASRFEEFGGIPRYLFKTDVIVKGQDISLEEIRAYQRSALTDIITNPNRIDDLESSDPFKSLWTIYHMEPVSLENGSTDYMKYTIQPCCQDAAIRIRDHLMQKGVQDLWNIFINTREELGILRGIRYEAYAHKKLLIHGLVGRATGLTQTGLSKSAPKEINIPAASTRINLPNNNVGPDLVRAVQRARTGQGGYLLPHLPNFPIVDAIFVPRGNGAAKQLQMKTGRSRPLATDKAASVSAATGSTDIYFIVPDGVTMTKKLPGVDGWHQYRVILREI